MVLCADDVQGTVYVTVKAVENVSHMPHNL